MPTWAAIAVTFAAYMVSMVGIFCGGFSTATVALLAALALGVGGLAPGAIYASAPRVAPTAETLPITVGMFQQASNLGQFAGPLLVGLVIEKAGWERVPIATVPLGIFGLGLAVAIRRQMSDQFRRSPIAARLQLPGVALINIRRHRRFGASDPQEGLSRIHTGHVRRN
jgi:predicted MFS family arabinose efflux permease